MQPGDNGLMLAQGDTGEGGVRRTQIAETLVRSLGCEQALGKTLELYATAGTAPTNWPTMFAALIPDARGASDGPLDRDTMPTDHEPPHIRTDLDTIHSHTPTADRSLQR